MLASSLPEEETPLIVDEVVARYAAEQTTVIRVANPPAERLARIIIRESSRLRRDGISIGVRSGASET